MKRKLVAIMIMFGARVGGIFRDSSLIEVDKGKLRRQGRQACTLTTAEHELGWAIAIRPRDIMPLI